MTIGVLVGAGDVGTAVAASLIASVTHIVAIDIDESRLARLTTRHGDAVRVVAGDINDEQVWSATVDAVRSSGEPVGWTVLTAGIGARGPLASLTPATVRHVFSTNVISPILLLRALLDGCEWARGSRIVGLGSISARRPLPERTVYGASKAALETFLTALGVELAPRDIAVNVVSAGVVDSDFIAAAREDLRSWARDRVPVRRLGMVAEVAEVIAYLATTAPAYIASTRIVVDGGAEALA